MTPLMRDIRSFLIAVLGIFLWLSCWHAQAQPLPYHSADKTLGVVSCASSLCHGSIAPWKGSEVLQNEYVVWSRLDKHARAYTVLLNERSREMSRKLSLPQPAHQSKLCLDCHAHNPVGVASDKHVLGDGVSCESCHGPAQRWISRHTEPQATHERNIGDGLYPLDQPVKRAELCLSCHLGNKDKSVNHRIMAAGHPRLSFEMDTFSNLQPSHGQSTTSAGRERSVLAGSQNWAVAQAVAVRMQVELLLDPVRGRDGVFPEPALFDCHACHRPMAEIRWTAQSNFGQRLAPGLIRYNDSSLVMLQLILRQTAPALAKQLGVAAAELHRGMAGQVDLLTAAQSCKDLAFQAVLALQANPLTSKQLRTLALSMVDEGTQVGYGDYVAAEQAAMALGSVLNALHGAGQLSSIVPVNASLARLRQTLLKDEHYNPKEFRSRLVDLRATLLSSLSKS